MHTDGKMVKKIMRKGKLCRITIDKLHIIFDKVRVLSVRENSSFAAAAAAASPTKLVV